MDTVDFLGVLREMVVLVKAYEIEKAVRLVDEAQFEARAESFAARQETIHVVSLALFEAQKQRDSLFLVIDGFAERERLFARAQILKICQTAIDPYISNLRIQKRRLSKP